MVILNYTQITDKETALVVQDQLTSSVIAVYTDSGALQSVILGFYVMLADYFVRVVNKPFVIRVEEINNEIVLVFYCANYLLSGILSPSARFDPESKSVLHILEHHPEIISLINLLRNIRGSGYIKIRDRLRAYYRHRGLHGPSCTRCYRICIDRQFS